MQSHHGVADYRPDVDGLRAFAVTLVVLFHTGISPLRGGFVGVDVFFVISGYLITRLIRREIDEDRFSCAVFYERRIRRILPALAVLIAAVLLASPFFLFPSEARTTALTAAAALSSASNILLLNSRGYFGSDAVSQPLIHTWSLGIEEQFYLAFPLVLMAFGRTRREAARRTVALLALVSLVGGIWLSDWNRDIAYYFPLTRAWELMVGSLVALFPIARLPRWLREPMAAGSLLLIVLSAWKFHPGLHFPGIYAAVPTLAAGALIVAGGSGGSLVSRAFSTGPVVGLGRISYSLYLWHWPIIVFTLLYLGRPLSPGEAVGLVAASVAAAFLSWRYVEQPFRGRGLVRERRQVFRVGALAYVALCLCSGALLWSTARPDGPHGEGERLAAFLTYDEAPVYRRGTCFLFGHLETPADYDRDACLTPDPRAASNLLLVGDSHGAHLRSGLDAALGPAGVHVMQATSSGCKPVLGGRGEAGCRALMSLALDTFLAQSPPNTLVLAGQWIESDIPYLVDTLRTLKGRVERIVVFGPIVEYYRPLPRLLGQVADGRDPDLLVTARTSDGDRVDALMQQAVEAEGVPFFSSYRFLCPSRDEPCTTMAGDVPVQWDYGHLTAEGSALVARAARAAGVFETAVPAR